MATYPLAPLLRARIFREDAATREARKAESALDEARKAAEAAREEWARYREWRPGEEKRLFTLLRGKDLPLSELDRHREDIQMLRDAELERERHSMAADKAVTAAEAALDKARALQLQATRDRRKIDEHRERWLIEENKRLEAAEEAELEEFSANIPSGDDDGESENSASFDEN